VALTLPLRSATSHLSRWKMCLDYGGLNSPGSKTRGYPISNFVYLLSADLPPALFENSEERSTDYETPNRAIITMGLSKTSGTVF